MESHSNNVGGNATELDVNTAPSNASTSDAIENEIPLINEVNKELLYIESPSPHDIICGRGKSGPHLGNQRFRRLVSSMKEAYQKARRREEKTRITQNIVRALRDGDPPCRYVIKSYIQFHWCNRSITSVYRFVLKDETGLWFDAGEDYAREKGKKFNDS
jgi:hypothetical protein